MKTNFGVKYLLLVLATLVFNYLFWKQGYGANVLIYTVFMMAIVIFLNLGQKLSKQGIILSTSLLFCSGAILLHSSTFTVVMYYISFILFIGWLHEKELKSLLFIAGASFFSLVKFPAQLVNNLPVKAKNRKKIQLLFKVLKLSVIPLVILLIFYFIYINANPVFENLANVIIIKINDVIVSILNAISFARFLFILLGIGIGGWYIFKTDLKFLSKNESNKTLNLFRKRIKQFFPNMDYVQNLKENTPVFYRKKFALSLKLKNEFISALVLLSLVNLLLLIVNIIDINWVWFGFEYSESFNLKQFVHEGTYLLIISILLSMGIMLYFFRKNMNFYHKSKVLKILAFAWIFQNLILTISVAIRNLHYITYWGLAYKRIGVILFLIAVCYGLVTLFIKIKSTKTTYYLLKMNSIAIYIILVLSGLFNWDGIIARHNINHPIKHHMETSYLLCLSDKILPMIDQKKYVLDQGPEYNSYADFSPYSYQEYYNLRVDLFIARYEAEGWQSWNYADWKAYNYFKNR